MPNRIHKKRLTALIDARNDDNASHSCAEAMSYREMRMPLNLEKPCPNAVMLTNRNKEWLEMLNLDLRYRIAAGLGVQYVKEHQEQLMEEAWQQLKKIRQPCCQGL